MSSRCLNSPGTSRPGAAAIELAPFGTSLRKPLLPGERSSGHVDVVQSFDVNCWV